MRDRGTGGCGGHREFPGRARPQCCVGDLRGRRVGQHIHRDRCADTDIIALAATARRQRPGNPGPGIAGGNDHVATAGDRNIRESTAADLGLGRIGHTVDGDRAGHADIPPASTRRGVRNGGVGRVDQLLVGTARAGQIDRCPSHGIGPCRRQLVAAWHDFDDVIGLARGQPAHGSAAGIVDNGIAGPQRGFPTHIQEARRRGRIELRAAGQTKQPVGEFMLGARGAGAKVHPTGCATGLGIILGIEKLDTSATNGTDIIFGTIGQATDNRIAVGVVFDLVAGLQIGADSQENRLGRRIHHRRRRRRYPIAPLGHPRFDVETTTRNHGVLADIGPIRDIADIDRNRGANPDATTRGRRRTVRDRQTIRVGRGIDGDRAGRRDLAPIGDESRRADIRDVDRHAAGDTDRSVGRAALVAGCTTGAGRGVVLFLGLAVTVIGFLVGGIVDGLGIGSVMTAGSVVLLTAGDARLRGAVGSGNRRRIECDGSRGRFQIPARRRERLVVDHGHGDRNADTGAVGLSIALGSVPDGIDQRGLG